jgi:hypothetical protein
MCAHRTVWGADIDGCWPCHRLYERRKRAALAIEQQLKDMHHVGDMSMARIETLLNLLTKFATSNQPNQRKGGLIGLAATAVGLVQVDGLRADGSHQNFEMAVILEKVVPPV